MTDLGELLAPHGFKFVPAIRSYQRNTPAGWESVHLALIEHRYDFDVVVDVGIRFDIIQRLLQGDADKRARTATIGCEYRNLIGIGQHRWPITCVSDVSPVAQGIVQACEATLFPFFKKFSDLTTVCEALRRDDTQAWILMPLGQKRQAIITAADALLK